MIIMKCSKCDFENKDTAKFCTRCGEPLIVKKKESGSSKVLIAILVVIIVILVASIGYFVINGNSQNDNSVFSSSESGRSSVAGDSQSGEPATTTSKSSESKEWVLIGSYSGSGTGTESINVPPGQIMIKLSAYPIKNYATNHLYVSGSNGESAGVDWGSTSAVATRSDSLTYTSSSSQTFTIDYYETVSWQVDFYRYQ